MIYYNTILKQAFASFFYICDFDKHEWTDQSAKIINITLALGHCNFPILFAASFNTTLN